MNVFFYPIQFEYQQAQLEAEIENLSWKVERADTYERGSEGELSANDRGVRKGGLGGFQIGTCIGWDHRGVEGYWHVLGNRKDQKDVAAY